MKKFIGSEFLTSTSTCTINCKQKSVDIEEHSDFLLEVLTKKGKKAIRGKRIAVERNCWTMQNAITLEQRRTKKMIEKVQAMEDIKKNYAKAI